MLGTAECARLLLGSLHLRGITSGCATDGDDFIWNTQRLFDAVKERYVSRVARQVRGTDNNELRQQLELVNHEVHKTLGVRPTRWVTVADTLGNLHRHQPRLRRALTDPTNVDIFAQIYTDSPKLLPDAYATLKTFYYTGLPLVMITHANEDWTWLKLQRTKILHFFSHVEIVNEKQLSKTAADWIRGARRGNILPKKSLAMGDSLSSDVQPAAKAKYGTIIWAPSHWGSVTSNGRAPQFTYMVEGIKDVVPSLMSFEDLAFN